VFLLKILIHIFNLVSWSWSFHSFLLISYIEIIITTENEKERESVSLVSRAALTSPHVLTTTDIKIHLPKTMSRRQQFVLFFLQDSMKSEKWSSSLR
jgi:hypothetical protein